MAQAWIPWYTTYIAPNDTISMFMHGFDNTYFHGLDLVLGPGNNPGIRPPAARLTVQSTHQHVDGTKAYTLSITNLTQPNGRPTPTVALVAFREKIS